MNRDLMHSSKSDDWATPPALFAQINERWGPFHLDPAANAINAKAPHYYTKDDDGLAQPWSGRVFVNPPYGKTIGRWIEKAIRSTAHGATVVLLIPARTGSVWFREAFEHASEAHAISGNVTFGSATAPATFGSVVMVLPAAGTPVAEATRVHYVMPFRHRRANRWYQIKMPIQDQPENG